MAMAAKTPAASAAAPMDTGDTDAGTDTGDTGASDSDSADAGPKVLLTVLDNGDGTYQLVEGDEDDGDDAAGGDDAAAPAPGAAPDAGADKGTTYDSIGALLKGIMDMVKKAEDAGEGGGEDNFAAGFSGGSSASPSKTDAGAAPKF